MWCGREAADKSQCHFGNQICPVTLKGSCSTLLCCQGRRASTTNTASDQIGERTRAQGTPRFGGEPLKDNYHSTPLSANSHYPLSQNKPTLEPTHTHRHTDKHTSSTNIRTYIYTYIQEHVATHTETQTQTDHKNTYMYTQTHRQTRAHTHTMRIHVHTHTSRQIQTHTTYHTPRARTDTQTHGHTDCVPMS